MVGYPSSITPPKDWQSFERCSRVLFKNYLKDFSVQANGRSGQRQFGVDIYGSSLGKGVEWIGVQCKGKEQEYGGKVTEKELRIEVEKAKSFIPKLDHFILITTARNDASIQKIAREITKQNRQQGTPLNVSVWGWGTLQELISQDSETLIAFHPDATPFTSQIISKIDEVKSLIPRSINFPDLITETRLTALQIELLVSTHLEGYEKWVEEYAPLMAEHKEFDTYVEDIDESFVDTNVSVEDLADHSQFSILIGESGSGKSTALWKILVANCKRIKSGVKTQIPVMISSKSLSIEADLISQIRDQLVFLGMPKESITAELQSGAFLILIDGINEISSSIAQNCYFMLAQFVTRYRKNSFVLTCRSSDYSKNMIPVRSIDPAFVPPKVFEIARLTKAQIIQYSTSYLVNHSIDPEEFFERIRINDDVVWLSDSSPVQLIRIPMFLQIYLKVYRLTRCLPESKAKLLKALVEDMLERGANVSDFILDRFLNSRVLGALAYKSFFSEHSLRLPIHFASDCILATLDVLRAEGRISSKVEFNSVWKDIFSANFLKLEDYDRVQWLHQLIRDYFLGCEIAEVWRRQSVNRVTFESWFASSRLDVACSIALSLLDSTDRSTFFMTILKVSDENARRAFEGQTAVVRDEMLKQLIQQILQGGDEDTADLRRLALFLPYRELAESFDDNFYEAPTSKFKGLLIDAISALVIEHYPKLQTYVSYYPYYVDPYVRSARDQSTRAAIKRCEQLLTKYLKNSDPLVSFYAAKGLWEHDKPAAMDQLRILLISKDAEVRKLVKNLLEEWGIYPDP